MNKQQHTRCLKPLKPTLNPNHYQFMLWISNQKWGIKFLPKRKTYLKLWK